jgi:hypothetical protein
MLRNKSWLTNDYTEAQWSAVELGYNVMKGTEYFVSL